MCKQLCSGTAAPSPTAAASACPGHRGIGHAPALKRLPDGNSWYSEFFVWKIGTLYVHATDESELVSQFEAFLGKCSEAGLKLDPKRMDIGRTLSNTQPCVVCGQRCRSVCSLCMYERKHLCSEACAQIFWDQGHGAHHVSRRSTLPSAFL